MKKIINTKRIIILMALVLIYSCAFLFVKVYAEKSILQNGEPSLEALYEDESEGENEAAAEDDSADKAETAPAETLPASEESRQPVEYINKKAAVEGYKLFNVSATSVSDDFEKTTTAEPPAVTTAPTTAEAPTTTSKQTEKTEPPATEPPQSASTELTPEEEEEIADDDDDPQEAEEPEEAEDDLQAEIVEEPEAADDFYELTPEELEALLQSLGIQSIGEAAPAPVNPSDVLYSGKSYKNETVTIYDTANHKIRTENAFDLVCEITNREVGDSMDPEAIKAQAVAVYTYIKYYEQKGEYAEIGTKGNVPELIKDCVEAVDGLAMYYDGKYIMSAFSASTGGFTAASKNVWGGDLPYLQSVANDFDYLDEKNYGKVTTYTVDEIREKIESKTDIKLSDNYSEWIRILSHNDNIYVGQLSIDGHTSAYINGRERTITGHIFRTYVLSIRSTAFTVSYSDGVFTFTTYGYGHGVGMSQIGANLYAKYGGYTFDQILHHYYTGITIS